MADISKIQLPSGGDPYNLKDATAIGNVSFSGNKLTFTRRDGTTTFDVDIGGLLAAKDAMVFKGVIDGGSTAANTAYTPAAERGDTYKVATDGFVNGISLDAGDILICITDSTAAATSSNVATVKANWATVQGNAEGTVTGPTSSTDTHVAIFDGASGRIIKDSGFTIGKSVPSNAVFTDTHHTAYLRAGTASGTANAATTTGNTHLLLVENDTHRSGVKLVPGSNMTITSDASGNVTFASSFTNSRDPGYGKIKSGAASSSTDGITANTTTAEAGTYNETITFQAGNKWIQTAANQSTTNGSDTFTIGHFVPNTAISNTGPSTAQTPGYGATFDIPVIATDEAGHVTGVSKTTVKIPASDNTDTKVTQTLTNPTSATSYRILATTATSTATQGSIFNNGIQYTTLEGTASAAGYGILELGNSTSTGTAGNKYGAIRIYGNKANYSQIQQEGDLPAANRTVYLPAYAGTQYLVAASTTNTVGGTGTPVYVKADGEITAITTAIGVSLGGTGKASWTKGGIVYASATTTLASLGVGTANQVLRSNGENGPKWNTLTFAAGTTPVTFSVSSEILTIANGTAPSLTWS